MGGGEGGKVSDFSLCIITDGQREGKWLQIFPCALLQFWLRLPFDQFTQLLCRYKFAVKEVSRGVQLDTYLESL